MIGLFGVMTAQFATLPYPSKSYKGQTIIVTGSNIGLGLEAGRVIFVRLEAQKVIIAVRTLEKGEEAKRSIEKSTKREGVVEVWKLDVSNYESVKAFAAKVSKELDRVDILTENAGILTENWNVNDVGDEMIIATNVIGTFLLALLLFPKLRETAVKYNVTPRLTVVASFVHHMAKFVERKK